MVGCAHGDDGDGVRPAARPAHHGGRRDDAGVEATGLLDPSGRAVEEGVGQAVGDAAAERDTVGVRDTGRQPPPASPSASGQVKSYDTDGGRAVFDIGPAYATLVSATPKAGWSMQVWKTESWIRVEYSAGADRVSVFCTWHDGPPRVEIGTY